ncbi:MAG: SWIM zinc finger family protein, partial [Candidatus Accumulibacter sp.]|nr:SWIM zinc finger family protein [Accumulibacter sp.]
ELYWGECQGSGTNPYRVVADASDSAYKCTCPSRKFPCKHTLALMWMGAANADLFLPAQAPEWVTDWLGRRRKGGGGTSAVGGTGAASSTAHEEKSIAAALQAPSGAEAAVVEDPGAAARRETARKQRAENTRAAIAAALEELEQWITDQLRLGLAAFIDNASERCRRIAARLVDQKAAALASRVDELPARLFALRNEERPEAVIRELGKLVLLIKAWRARPDDPEIRRQVSTSETREHVLGDPEALVVHSAWEALGERIQTRRDGLVSHATWLMNLHPGPCAHALLLDFHPASAGKRAQSFAAGEQFEAALAFYPSPAPLRALIVDRSPIGERRAWRAVAASPDPLAACAPFWNGAPWGLECPLVLPPGRVVRDREGRGWWRADEDEHGSGLPLARETPLPVLGMALSAAAGLWDGMRLDLFAAQSAFGRIDLS